MIPLLLGAGRMLAAGAARGAASGAARGAITGGIKESVKKGIVDGAKNKAKSFIKNKITKAKKVSPDKLIPRVKKGGGGKGLVKRKSTAIIKRPTSSIVKSEKGSSTQEKEDKGKQEETFNGDELIKELTAIKETLIKIKGVLGSNLASKLKDQRNQRILKSKQKASEKESELEKKKPDKSGGPKLGLPKKKLSFLDMIWRFISNVLMGSLLNFLFNYVPQIIKMFEDIAKGLENPLQVLRLGIISLSVVFRKQISFLGRLTAKIIGPPARLIGKLLLKAGGVAKKLFQKAGSVIFNLIKGPLSSLIKKVGGEALEQGVKSVGQGAGRLAGRVAGGAGAAAGRGAQLLSRLGVFRRILSKPPIIGALIGFIIDLIMGEKPARAAAGAAGAAIGAGIGGWLGGISAGALAASTFGIGALAAPFIIGAGGFLGSAIGDWAGKAIYDKVAPGASQVNKEAPIEKKAGGGGIGGFFSSLFGGGSRTPSKSSSSVQKGASKSTKLSVGVEKKAKEGVLKDEKSLNRFRTLSSIFAGTPFVGQLLKMGIDIGLGAGVEKSQTDAAAQELGFSIGSALENEEFSVPGLNKRIIGPLTKNLTEWAKKKIFNEVKNREGLFPSIGASKDVEEKKDAPSAGPGGGGDEDGGLTGPGPVVTGGTADFWAMAAVASLENSNPQGQADVAQVLYNRLASGKYSGKSIKELVIAKNQFQPTREGDPKVWAAISDKQSAIAAVATHPRGRTNAARMVEAAAAAIQNAALQRSSAQFVGGRTDFSATGQYTPYPGAIGIVKRHGHDIGWFVGPGSIAYGKTNPGPAKAPRLGDIAVSAPTGGRGGTGGGPSSTDGEPPGNAQTGKKGKIYLHWNVSGSTSNPVGYSDRYHAVFTGDGKKHQVNPYSNFNTPGGHTAYRNSEGVGLAVAGMSGSGDAWKSAPTNKQYESMAKEAASIAKSWGWNAGMVNVRNVATHAEVGAMKDGIRNPNNDNYGPVAWGGDGAKWDLFKLSKSDPDGSGGTKIRNMIKANMGDGIGVQKPHKLPSIAMGGGHTVTSSMGMRNFALSPGMHMGIDISGTTGEPLQAFTDGVVEGSGYEPGGYGNWVSWVDDKGIGNFYGHMNKSASVKSGQRVKKGTILGELGSTGRSSGPHLHWEAATNPKDTGQPKSAVLSRFNPLSKYNKESPFGGSIKPDPSLSDGVQGQPAQPGTPGDPGSTNTDSSSLTPDKLALANKNVIRGDLASDEYAESLNPEGAAGGMGGGSGISVTSNGGGNKQLKPGKTYGFGDLNPHHSDEGVTRSYGEHRVGVPKDYGMGILPQYMPSGPNGNIPLPVSGKVLLKEWVKTSGYGRTVLVDTSVGKMQFSHLSRFGNFNQGDQLSAGTIIGTQGGSGSAENTYAEHLHINAPKAGHEAFVNFITSGKPTTGSVSSDSGEGSQSPSGSQSSSDSQSSSGSSLAPDKLALANKNVIRGDLASDEYAKYLGSTATPAPAVPSPATPAPATPLVRPIPPILPPPPSPTTTSLVKPSPTVLPSPTPSPSTTPANITSSTSSTAITPSKIDSLKQKPSYDQGGQSSIILMQTPQSSQQSTPNQNISSQGSSGAMLPGLNRTEIACTELKLCLQAGLSKV